MNEKTSLKTKIIYGFVALLLSASTYMTGLAAKALNQAKPLAGAGTDVSTCFPDVGGAATTTGLLRLTHDDGTTRTATTTLISSCPINRASDLAFNYIVGGTTTRAVDFVFQFSDDNGTWFNEVNQTLDSNQLTSIGTGTSTPRRYLHNFNGTSTKQLPLIPTAARYVRVLVQSTGSNVGSTSIWVWGSLSKREGNN